jgi:hypothetical protein
MYAQHGRLGLNDDYGQIVQAARDSDEIEPTDFRRLVSTDIVVSARREGRIHIFPAEVSNTLSKRDVDQAVRTSSLISQVFRNKVGPVTGTEYGDLAVQPMVAGAVVPDLNLAMYRTTLTLLTLRDGRRTGQEHRQPEHKFRESERRSR